MKGSWLSGLEWRNITELVHTETLRRSWHERTRSLLEKDFVKNRWKKLFKRLCHLQTVVGEVALRHERASIFTFCGCAAYRTPAEDAIPCTMRRCIKQHVKWPIRFNSVFYPKKHKRVQSSHRCGCVGGYCESYTDYCGVSSCYLQGSC